MSDLIFVGIVIVFFIVSGLYVRLLREAVGGRHGNHCRRDHRAVLFIYLFVAMIRPEKF